MNEELKAAIARDEKKAKELWENLANIRQGLVNGDIATTERGQAQLAILQATYDRLAERIERNKAELDKGEQA